MSGDDETFDIDLYGDEEQENEVETFDGTLEQNSPHNGDRTAGLSSVGDINGSTSTTADQVSNTSGIPTGPRDSTAPLPRGTKRGAPDDTTAEEQDAGDAGAQISIKLTELQWWTTEDDLRVYSIRSNVESELVEVAFNEHKINGKSKGEAYMEFQTTRAAGLTKREIEKENEASKTKITVWYTTPGNPFRVRDGMKKDAGSKFGGNQGAYNHFPSQNRGSYAGRGRGNYNNVGRGGQWQNQNQNHTQQNQHQNQNYNQQNQSQSQNQMMGGFGNMQFPTFNPMNMNQNLMNTMMGMGMQMQNMMAGRGGMMNNRGGWNNAGARGGAQQNGGQSNNGWDGNKRPRRE